jgi:hypothetical protein
MTVPFRMETPDCWIIPSHWMMARGQLKNFLRLANSTSRIGWFPARNLSQ